jgi:hypothetical protein
MALIVVCTEHGGVEPYAVCQARWPRTATGGEVGMSSVGVKTRLPKADAEVEK